MAKAQSLAAQSGSLTIPEFKMPSVFQAPQADIKSRFIAPYVVFAHPNRDDEWKKLVNKFGSVNEGDMYLVMQDAFHKMQPLVCYWIRGIQYWAEVNPSGEVLRTSFKEMPDPWKEHIEAAIIVHLESKLIPANISFRTTKCGAGKAMADALAEAATPAWLDKSPAHKESAVVPEPFGRFYCIVDLGPQRTSKRSGRPYRTTVCNVKPTGPAEWRVLAECWQEPAFLEALNQTGERFAFRTSEAERKLVK